MKYIFIVNPNAGKGRSKNLIPKIEEECKKRNWEFEIRYISEEKSTESGYNLDVYVSFSKPLYTENDESNEEYFTKLIEDCAKVIVYKPFKLIDNEHNIIIKVICSKGQIEKIYINDMEDYYIYMDSQLSLKKYKEIETTSFSVQSEV